MVLLTSTMVKILGERNREYLSCEFELLGMNDLIADFFQFVDKELPPGFIGWVRRRKDYYG